MMLKNYKLWLAMAVVLAIAAGMISVTTLQKFSATEIAIAAAGNIDPSNPQSMAKLKQIDVARGNYYEDTIRSASELEGMVPKGYIPADTILRKSMFQPAEMAGIAGKLSALEGNRVGVAIANNLHTSVAGNLSEGDIVDVYIQPKGGLYELALRDVPVLQGATINQDKEVKSAPGLVLGVLEHELGSILQGQTDNQSILLVLKPRE